MSYDIDSKNHFKTGLIDFTAGTLGAIALVYVGQPLDTIKVKMQTFPHLYKNMVDCFKVTLISDGIYRGLYAGTGPALLANITENSILFLCYGMCQEVMRRATQTDKIQDLSVVSSATAGCLASFFSTVALCPTELIKCKLQAMHEVHKEQEKLGKKVIRLGPSALVSQIVKADGVMGLFRGFVPTIVREMPGYFFFFGGYEGSRILFTPPGKTKDDIGLWRTMVAGAIGGMCFWTSTFPIDVAKSRIQVQGSNDGLVKTVVDIFKKEGTRALFKGLTPTLIRTVPATATLFVTYEYSKKFMTKMSADL